MRLKYNRLYRVEHPYGVHLIIVFDVLDDRGEKREEYCYGMPPDIFEWRVAEYGELTEDELVEMVVAEAALALDEGNANEGLTTLSDAPSQEVARKDHLTRCARAKLMYRISTQSGPEKLRDALKAKISIDKRGVREKRRRLFEAIQTESDRSKL